MKKKKIATDKGHIIVDRCQHFFHAKYQCKFRAVLNGFCAVHFLTRYVTDHNNPKNRVSSNMKNISDDAIVICDIE